MSDDILDYVPRVYRFALRLTSDPHQAEDLTQETFLQAWEKKSSLRDQRAIRAWLFRIAVNLWRAQLRQPRMNETVFEESETSARQRTPDQDLLEREELARALSRLDALPPRQREVLYLVAVEQLSLSEVSEILDINKNTAKVNLSLARKQMREFQEK